MSKINFNETRDLINAREKVYYWKNKGYKVFYIKGVFDLFHEGHIAFLQYIKTKIKYKYGDNFKVIVSIESDLITKKKKGKHRPYDNEHIRKNNIKKSGFIDFVFVSNNRARFLIKEMDYLGVDYFVVPDEYVKHIKLYYLLKSKLNTIGVSPLLSRHKQYDRYGVSKNLSLIHTTGIENKNFLSKIKVKVKHISYLTSELLYLLFLD